ncbi:MAG: Flp pilus assembly complex ATPase component TadA [Candidatus Omnitrophica bacterium]|nr:Flp pilus assembly complex ATPase component TadA [Candidatus Omnitrophota bacterium]
MAETLKTKILARLLDSLKLKKEDLDAALKLQKEKGIPLERVLMEQGLINEQDLLLLLVKELHIPFINLKKYKIDLELKTVITEKVARQYHIVPLSQMEDTLTIALSDPLNIFALDDIKNITGKNIDVVMSTNSEILHAIDHYYGSKATASVSDISKSIEFEQFEIVSEKEGAQQDDVDAQEGEQAPIIRLVNLIIQESLKQRASDIHIEPMADLVRVRYRVDGVLLEAMNFPKSNQNSVLVRLKIMARLDITATRTPQDGRFKMNIGAKEVDFRVSVLPTIFGQKVVMRILDRKNLSIGLNGLGFSEHSIKILQEGIHSPFGMILVTGPTGSGKSTTLYSIINELNSVERNIITVEDPVEYLIEGLTQIHVRSDIGLTFASGLRAILRQSPDIVMVGEIRDVETADISIKAALTGQMVFSTLHTNDAAGALTRLVDMGVEPFLVASSIVLVCAQRLCRRICTHCKHQVEAPSWIAKGMQEKIPPGTIFYEGKGCDYCRMTGYRGRIGITEVFQVDDMVREMLILGKSSDEIKEYAHKTKGMRLLWDEIMDKFISGETTVQEVLRLTMDE